MHTDTNDNLMAEIEGDLAIIEAEANLARKPDDDGWIVDWYMQQTLMLDAAHQAIDNQAAVLHHQLESRRKALEYCHGNAFQAEAHKRIQALKKGKTVTTFFGKFGLRSTGGKARVNVIDEEAAIAAAELTAPECISVKKSLLKTAVMALHDQGVDLPGVQIIVEPKMESFFIKTETKALPSAMSDVALIEGETSGE